MLALQTPLPELSSAQPGMAKLVPWVSDKAALSTHLCSADRQFLIRAYGLHTALYQVALRLYTPFKLCLIYMGSWVPAVGG